MSVLLKPLYLFQNIPLPVPAGLLNQRKLLPILFGKIVAIGFGISAI